MTQPNETDSVFDTVITKTKEASMDVTKILEEIWKKIEPILPRILFALIALFIGLLLVKVVLKIVKKVLIRANVDNTAVGFVKGMVKALLTILVYIICLSILNVPMTSIITILGAMGLAIGLALQSSLSNIAGGFLLLFEKPFKAGDYIETAGCGGTVETVGILYTRVSTPDNKLIYIPNSAVTNSSITNASKKETRRVDLEFAISYESDYVAAQRTILEVIQKQDKVLQNEDITIRIGRNESNARVIFVRVWCNNSNYWNVYFDMQEQIISAFKAANFVIPYPQVTVHSVA